MITSTRSKRAGEGHVVLLLGPQNTGPANVLARQLDDEIALINPESGEYYALDDVGTAMWQALLSSTSLGARSVAWWHGPISDPQM